MDFGTSTEGLCAELKLTQENTTLLEIVKELCSEPNSKLSPKLKGKVSRIISECDLKHHTSLQRVSTADDTTSTLLGFMHQTEAELTYDEQVELNQAFIDKIEKKLPECTAELEQLKQTSDSCIKCREEQLKELKDRDSKLDLLQEQESEKMDLMMEWLNFRIQGVSKFSDNSSELLALKTKILNLKSKILHLQILQNIFTETNQSIKAYNEIHKDLKESIKETEKKIKDYREIIEKDFS
uniref:Uncharacterized protein n=1 Tax=Pectinophora gossypiella TaxID=13191 RepID=A0A1E1WD45_PECGO